MKKTISIISPMYPTKSSPGFGPFVKRCCDGLKEKAWIIQLDAVIYRRVSYGFLKRIIQHIKYSVDVLMVPFKKRNLIYIHSPYWSILPIFLWIFWCKIPIVVNLHGAEVHPESILNRLFMPFLKPLLTCNKVKLIVVPSSYFALETHRILGVAKEKIYVSPSAGVNTKQFTPVSKNMELCEKLGFNQDDIIIGYVGRLDVKKGWDTFLEVISSLNQQNRKVKGLAIGQGSEISLFKAKQNDLLLTEHVVFIEGVPHIELPDYFNLMDILLFPSRRLSESLGLVPIEAMACGVPVIGSNIAAVSEYINNGVNGYLCQFDNADDFIEKTKYFLTLSKEERKSMHLASREIAKKYDMEKVLTELSTKFTTLLNKEELEK
jgi:L-malate glycosyltransferase